MHIKFRQKFEINIIKKNPILYRILVNKSMDKISNKKYYNLYYESLWIISLKEIILKCSR